MDRLFPELQGDQGYSIGSLPSASSSNATHGFTPRTNEISPKPHFTDLLNVNTPFIPATASDISALPGSSANPNGFPIMLSEWFLNGGSMNQVYTSNVDSSLNNDSNPTAGTPDTSLLPGAASGFTDSPLLPDGTVNWTTWDNLVQQYGMELDQETQTGPGGGPYPYGNTFSSIAQWY
jgi:hypothetical protein